MERKDRRYLGLRARRTLAFLPKLDFVQKPVNMKQGKLTGPDFHERPSDAYPAKAILPVLNPFATLFRTPTWRKAEVLLVGAILAPGQRTVASALRVMGLSGDRNYARYHHVLNRAAWSPLQAAHILLNLLIQYLDQGDGPLVFGIDETVERRGGPKISARGIYRDAVRSSRSYLVKVSGLRWVCLMWLGHIPWAGRYWALPFLTVLAPSERYFRQRGRTPQKLTGRARQMVLQLRRWLPRRPLVLVGDSGYAVLDLLHFCQSLPQPYLHNPFASGRGPLGVVSP